MKRKLIITSVITAALMAAGMVGGTIAYFSTSNKTDVNITSGKINVTSVVSDLKTYSLEHEQNPAGSFDNGGEASLTGNDVTLDRMSPGDKATFKIAITCDNNIKIKYRVAFNKTGDLAPALVANVSGGAADWTLIEPSETPTVVNLDASIEMPISTGIEYSNKQGQVRILVEAVQGNMPQAVSSAAELEDAIDAIPAEGGEVSLYVEENITLTDVMAMPSNAQINLYGDGTKTISNAPGASRVVNFDEVENTTLTLSGVELHQDTFNGEGYARTISAYGTTDCTINVYDSKLTNDSHYPINVAGQNTGLTINVEDSVLEGYCAVNVWSPATINIKNSTLKGLNKSSGVSNAFGVFVFDKDNTNSSAGAELNLQNCVVESRQTGDQSESFFILKASGVSINSTNTVYKYYRLGATQPEVYNSVEEVFDYNSWSLIYDTTIPKLSLSLNAIDYTDSGSSLEYSFAIMSIAYSIYDVGELTDTSPFIYGEVAAIRQTKVGANTYATPNLNVNGKQVLMPCNLITE